MASNDIPRVRSGFSNGIAMDRAAAGGHLHVIQWLHEHHPHECPRLTMDNAVFIGNLEIVQWLHANRIEGYSTQAMNVAASNGHLDIIQ